ncbi:MAG: phosphatidylserine decarboxylase family protein [Bacteroidota bacterium]|nr:phosphatidylserine decarboxylase family protein [Bacteroidota bacterium]
MKLHKEGLKILRNEMFIFTIVNYITYWNSEIIFCYFTLPLTIALFLLSLYFFRIPRRNFERKDGAVYAPCDGKVVVIEETDETEFYHDKRIQISIFMSPLNVHNNRYPTSGEVTYTKYHPGRFLVAWHPKASSDNEHNTIVVENKNISILFKQIAGAIARRIVTYAKVGETVNSSDECGFIKFGSRVDIFLPVGTKICTTLNKEVKGGQSVIATY